MADIKRFTGFIAPDGTTHDTIKKATEHTNALKIKEALQKRFTDGGVGDVYVYMSDMAEYLFNNKEAIELCFAEKALLRATRKPKLAIPTAASAKAVQPATVALNATGMSTLAQSEAIAAGIKDLDD